MPCIGDAGRIRYPPDLPITARKDEILAALRDHQVVIVAGETGSGKSTQLPKMCLDQGRGVDGRLIGHTQPRRLAARTIAERVAEELGTTIGGRVGFTVRFTDRVGPQTQVKVMTDGILLNEIQRDRQLHRYDTLIVDEAHERSLNVDFILGYLTRLLPHRADLKVIVTSATIDTARFAEHFGGAPVIEVSGRTWPVEVRYEPVVADDAERDQVQAIGDAVVELSGEGPGDILVFLSGEREIRDTADALRRMDLAGTEVLPLYARLSAAEQHRVFQPHRGRRVVLATNVAETSLTVPGIRYVVDPGTARISRFSRRTKVQRLPIEAVSQASANQRAGRCGREGPGVCIRLYSEDDFRARPEFTEPEILRTNLASVILQMAALGLGDVQSFPFVEPPDARSIKDGVALLEELGALDASTGALHTRLTPVGRRLARLPVDPRLGRMVLEADRRGCVREVLVIAAALAIQDPRERPADARAAADEQHARFADPDSDFLAYVRLWEYLRDRQRELSSNQFRRRCHAEFLNYLRVREWQDVHSQLRQIAGGMGIHASASTEPGDRDAIHLSLLAGLLSHLGMRDGRSFEYVGARNARFAIGPGSALFKNSPRWVMAAELVETTRLWAHVVARVQPEWAEHVGGHLVKRTYSEPRWDERRGAAVATERVTLYGLPIVAARTVGYARIDTVAARDLFVQHALVDGEWQTHHAFARDNRALVDEVRALGYRARRDVLVSEDVLFDFFDARVPADVTNVSRFDRWWNTARQDDPRLLHYTRELLLRDGDVDPDDFPDTWRQGDVELELSYVFAPGSPDDGVHVHVPLVLLDRVAAAGFDWQVPGLRDELVTTLIRSLPKALRRNFAPAGDHAREFLAHASPDDGPILDVLAGHLARAVGIAMTRASFDTDRIPDHLRLTYVVEDEGRVVAVGADLDALRRHLRAKVQQAVADAAPALERTGMRTWELDELPRTIDVRRDRHTVNGYPALVDEGDTAGVRVFADAAAQTRAMRAGTRRLLLLAFPSARKAVARLLPRETTLALAHRPSLLNDCMAAAVDEIVDEHGGPAWDAAAFDRLRAAVGDDVVDRAVTVARDVAAIVTSARAVEQRLERLVAPVFDEAAVDIRGQLTRLLPDGFVVATGATGLRDLTRYVTAIERRLDKLTGEPARDAEKLRRVQRLEQEFAAARRALPPDRSDVPAVAEVRRLLEELRVSLFAQSLGTAVRVSEERVRRAIAGLHTAERLDLRFVDEH